MLRKIARGLVAGALLAGCFSGCGGSDGGDVCARAQAILQGCGVPGNQFPTCDGDPRGYAQCTVDHETDVCSGLSDGANLNNAFNKCVSQFSKP